MGGSESAVPLAMRTTAYLLIRQVADYSILATEALSSSYGPGDAEVAK